MTNKADNYSRGDLVLLWDDVYDSEEEVNSFSWEGYYMMPPRRMKHHGKVGIILSRNDVFDDIYESQTYWVLVEDRREEVHKNYMRKVNNNENVR